ncbi:MAG: DinB family protein [Flavobacteriales bacterium]|nr:DinB family protein [Flavobacteriales bacterium]MCC6936880.1 DinB family protein [Flavobacteriales bacterium]
MNAWGRPEAKEFAPYYKTYIDQCSGDDVFAALEGAERERSKITRLITDERALFSYGPGKWRLVDVLQHLIDCERVFAYRAMRIARGDGTPLPGFEENAYAEIASGTTRRLNDVVEEMGLLRRSTVALFKGLAPKDAIRIGTASGDPFSVRALGWAIAGHELHHVRIINERYLDHGNT